MCQEAFHANHSRDVKLAKRLHRLCERLRDAGEAYTDDPRTIQLTSVFSPPKYTPKQGQYLAFMYYYTKIHRQAPAEGDLQRYFKVTAPTAHRMVVVLEERGFIERSAGQPRSIRLLIGLDELPDLE